MFITEDWTVLCLDIHASLMFNYFVFLPFDDYEFHKGYIELPKISLQNWFNHRVICCYKLKYSTNSYIWQLVIYILFEWIFMYQSIRNMAFLVKLYGLVPKIATDFSHCCSDLRHIFATSYFVLIGILRSQQIRANSRLQSQMKHFNIHI